MDKARFAIRVMLLVAGFSLPVLAAENPANVPAVSSITQLRATPAIQYQTAYLTQYSSTTGIGSGEFVYTGQTSCSSDNGGTLIQTVFPGTSTPSGCYARKTLGQPYNIAWFGAQCGGVQVTDGVSINGNATVTSVSDKWTANMVGWIAVVNKAAASSKQLRTTIASFNNSGSIVLANTAGASGTAETISVYPDDFTAMLNTANAAHLVNAGITLPSGQTCGVNGNSANPFLRVYSSFYGNNGTLWLSQTGPDSTYGESLVFGGLPGSTLVGPVTIDGLYETDQDIAQFNIPGVQFDAGVNNGAIIGNVTIQNTKGRCVTGGGGVNFTITDLLIQNCGDFVYDNSGNPNDQAGRSMGVQLDGYDGDVTVKGFTSIRAAQSAILVSGFGSEPISLHVSISDCKLSYSGYFNFDFELNNGTVDVSNCQSYSQGGVPSGGILYGGFISRDTKYLHVSDYTGLGTDGSAFIALNTDVDANLIDLSLNNVNIIGSAANHKGQISISAGFFGSTEGHQYINLNNVRYDNFTFSSAPAPTCSASQPYQQLFQFAGLRANQVANQGSGAFDTNFNPQANNGTLVYLLGRDSSLGTVNINTAVNYTKGQYFDWSSVRTNGVLTFSGSASSSIDASVIATLPGNNTPGINAFTCP